MKNKKQIIDKTNTKIFKNILYAIFILMYFVSTYIAYIKLSEEIFSRVLQGTTMILLAIAIIIFEIAYKKDSGIASIYGIEFMVLAVHILLIERITQAFNFNTAEFITTTSYIWPIYYCFKAIIIYTRENVKKLTINKVKTRRAETLRVYPL